MTLPPILSTLHSQYKAAEVLSPITVAHQKLNVEQHHIAEKLDFQASLKASA